MSGENQELLQKGLSEDELNLIIEKAKHFFRNDIVPSHIKNAQDCRDLSSFRLNPFLDKYKATFITGNDDPKSIAKALVYPRVIGTSLNTIFGSKLQKFCSEVLEGFASAIPGLDIEFIDKLDGRRKYCQIKAGTNTINADDVDTIKSHFKGIKNLAKTNNLNIGLNDLVIGVFYGTPSELSGHYKRLQQDHPVIVGVEFWQRLTGHADFYQRITDAIGDVASEYDGSALVENIINALAKQIEDSLKP
ncbi:PmeII family type II restriction endonuclease [Paenibacillus solisilvae]|uniref:PmeII family type II restriction endonuclease n=1 Tax=Paenibacillus solisilvae TaxID=2486751 RepID=A0ABW0VPK1_9BACL